MKISLQVNPGPLVIPTPHKPLEPSAPSPVGCTKSGTSYLSNAESKAGLYPLQEVSNREMGTIKVHVPFSMSDLAQIKQLG